MIYGGRDPSKKAGTPLWAPAILVSRASRGIQDPNNRRTSTEARMVAVVVVAPLRIASMASSLIPRSAGMSIRLSVMYWVTR
jgi:hypothetical protein